MFIETLGKWKVVLPNGAAKNIPDNVLKDLVEEEFPLTQRQEDLLGKDRVIFYVPLRELWTKEGMFLGDALDDGVRSLELNMFMPVFLRDYCGEKKPSLIFQRSVELDYEGIIAYPTPRGQERRMRLKHPTQELLGVEENLPRSFLSGRNYRPFRVGLHASQQY